MRKIIPLSDRQISAAKPKDAPYKLFDGGGMFLFCTPTGGKLWRLKYSIDGKEKLLALGAYPDISLKDARQKREEAKEQLAKGIDPGEQKKEAKAKAAAIARDEALTFDAVAREWFAKKTGHLTPGYRNQLVSRLENQLLPDLGGIRFSTLEPADILKACRRAEGRGNIETAHRLLQLAGQITRFARICGYAKYDVGSGLSEALQHVQRQHYAAITDPAEAGSLLRAIDEYPGDLSVKYALCLLPYVFLRSKEIRGAGWAEIDFDKAEWIVPAERMKSVRGMRSPHIVPMSRQVTGILKDLRQYTGGGKFLFPSPFNVNRQISDMGLLNALRRLGYGKDEMTVHGFRGMASTLLNELGYRAEVIEAQLSHHERDSVRAAYNHAEYMPERRKMMQEWADYLDGLKDATAKD
jgi:integrase